MVWGMLEKVRQLANSLIARAIQSLRVLAYRVLSSNELVGSPRRYQPILCLGTGRISVDEEVAIGVPASPSFFTTYAYLEARNASAAISIGTGTWISNNFSAIAEHASISIGKNCLIGTNVEIVDSDFHGMKVEERRLSRPEWARPVRLDDNVFVGSNVTILKGVHIGDGSVIANGSIVTKDVPSGVIAGGNPAQVIRANL